MSRIYLPVIQLPNGNYAVDDSCEGDFVLSNNQIAHTREVKVVFEYNSPLFGPGSTKRVYIAYSPDFNCALISLDQAYV